MFVLTEPFQCPYLADRRAVYGYNIIHSIKSEHYEKFLVRGWRRFANFFFFPRCPSCQKCISMRLVVGELQMSRSQKRALKKNEHIRLEIKRPIASDQHLEIYHRYHRFMADFKKWPYHDLDGEEYYEHFIGGYYPFAWQIDYFDKDRLLGVALLDITDHALSSTYFFYDPEWRPLSPGVFSILKQYKMAQQRHIPHQYLGYWIKESPNMVYKAQYNPHEILQANVPLIATPVWYKPDDDDE